MVWGQAGVIISQCFLVEPQYQGGDLGVLQRNSSLGLSSWWQNDEFLFRKEIEPKNLIKVITSFQETKARVKEKFYFLG